MKACINSFKPSTMEAPYLYISFLLLLASYFFTLHLHRKFSNLPPTVFPTLPIIGHLYLLKPPVYRTFAKISAKYGPILLLRLGSRRVVLLSSPSAAEECFTKNDIIFANRPRMLFGKIIGNNYNSLVWSPYGDTWRNFRRIASNEILSTLRLNEFQDIRVDEGRILIRKLLSHSSMVDMKSVLYELTLNVMMRMISGKRYFGDDTLELEEEGKRIREILEESFLLSGAANVGDYLPILSWLGGKGLEKKLLVLKEKRDVFFQGLIEQLRKSRDKKKKTMIEVLLSRQESDPKYYTDEMIRGLFMVLLSGGTDTSAGTMEWAMSLLLNNPQVLQKAQHEMDTVIGTDKLIDELDAIHHDPNIWVDPERFDPERFEGVEGTRDGFKFIPFGLGRRSCPGEGLAMRVIGLTLGLLIQCFEWERVSEKMIDMTEGFGLNMPKAEPLVAKFSLPGSSPPRFHDCKKSVASVDPMASDSSDIASPEEKLQGSKVEVGLVLSLDCLFQVLIRYWS
ncbi:unnamed protein product [Lactuca virosa]|uniref:Cytochrome P450 n=1 Tax=Lactuca virosa TaxID=75947 RepID=A0AAU9NXX4_9ASTR|nr:unnamed protein product [Lactuca virosa]